MKHKGQEIILLSSSCIIEVRVQIQGRGELYGIESTEVFLDNC